jgi:hypothetical protein
VALWGQRRKGFESGGEERGEKGQKRRKETKDGRGERRKGRGRVGAVQRPALC